MGKEAPPGAKVDRRIEAEPIVVGERRIQPVARLVGWEMGSEEQAGPFAASVGRLTPLEIRIDTGQAQEVISIEDPSKEPIRGILALCAVVSTLSVLIMLVAQVAARRK